MRLLVQKDWDDELIADDAVAAAEKKEKADAAARGMKQWERLAARLENGPMTQEDLEPVDVDFWLAEAA